MKNSAITYWFFLAILALTTSCKSEFERVRTSGDPNAMLEKANAYYTEGDYLKAQTLYELVVTAFRGQKEAEMIAYNYANTYYQLEQYLLAAYYFKNFATTYGGSSLKEDADFMTAYSNYQLSPTYRLDQSYSLKAIEEFQEFINRYPSSDRIQECNSLIDGMRQKLEFKEFEAANLYFDLQQYQSAVRSYDNLLIEFPDTERAEEVRYKICRSAFLLAQNSFVEKQQERYEEALKRTTIFLSRYPSSSYNAEVRKMQSDSQKRLKQLTDV